MRHPIRFIAPSLALLLLGACGAGSDEAEVNRAIQDAAVADSNINDIFLTVADPNEAIGYFTRSLAVSPDNIALQRGLAGSLTRAQRPADALPAWQAVAAHPQATDDDRVELAGAYIRTNNWDQAEATLNAIPPTFETYERYRLEAVVADGNEDWARADSFYETAVGLTTTPASILNNWGFSKLTRGDYPGAERLFTDALRQDPTMFTAKNNLVLARGAQRNYDLPVIQMSQVERAQLLHTLALTAIKQNDIEIGRRLLTQAIETHPQHFEEAVRALAALDSGAAAL